MKTAPTLWSFAWNIIEINSPLAIFYSPQINWKARIYLCERYRNIWFAAISMWIEPCFTTTGLLFYFYVFSGFFLYPPSTPLIGISLYSSLAPVPMATNTIANGQQFKYRLSPHLIHLSLTIIQRLSLLAQWSNLLNTLPLGVSLQEANGFKGRLSSVCSLETSCLALVPILYQSPDGSLSPPISTSCTFPLLMQSISWNAYTMTTILATGCIFEAKCIQMTC